MAYSNPRQHYRTTQYIFKKKGFNSQGTEIWYLGTEVWYLRTAVWYLGRIGSRRAWYCQHWSASSKGTIDILQPTWSAHILFSTGLLVADA
eukprot:3287809-Rhodomonas_salina.3